MSNIEIQLLVSYKCVATYDRKDKLWHTKVIHGDCEKSIYGKTLPSLIDHIMDQYEPEGQCSCFYKDINGKEMEIVK